MSQPKSIIVLFVWLLWATGQDLSMFARFASTADYYIFASLNLAWLFFFTAGSVFLLNTAALWYVFRPEPLGYNVLLIALAAGIFYLLLSTSLALLNLDNVKEAYALGRELRGLAVSDQALNALFTQQSMLGLGALSLLVYCALIVLTLRNKAFFYGVDTTEDSINA